MILSKKSAPPNDSSAVTLAQAFANDSQLTLVAPSSACTALTMTADSVLNTTFAHDGVPLYKLKSSGTGPRTDLVRCGSPDMVVGAFDRRLFGNVVLRPSGEKVKASKWASFVNTNVCVSLLPRAVSDMTQRAR
jgi:hypothetical protein